MRRDMLRYTQGLVLAHCSNRIAVACLQLSSVLVPHADRLRRAIGIDVAALVARCPGPDHFIGDRNFTRSDLFKTIYRHYFVAIADFQGPHCHLMHLWELLFEANARVRKVISVGL
jgi:hypothetical protein